MVTCCISNSLARDEKKKKKAVDTFHHLAFGEIHRELKVTQEKKNDEQTKRTVGEKCLKKHLRHVFLSLACKETRRLCNANNKRLFHKQMSAYQSPI